MKSFHLSDPQAIPPITRLQQMIPRQLPIFPNSAELLHTICLRNQGADQQLIVSHVIEGEYIQFSFLWNCSDHLGLEFYKPVRYMEV